MVTDAAKAEAELCLRWGKAAEPAKAEAELCLRWGKAAEPAKAEAELCLRWGKAAEPAKAEAELCLRCEVIFPGQRQARGDGGVRRHRAVGDGITLLAADLGLQMASGRGWTCLAAGLGWRWLDILGEGWRWRPGEGKGAGDLEREWLRRPRLAEATWACGGDMF